jgi:hypothetical protein
VTGLLSFRLELAGAWAILAAKERDMPLKTFLALLLAVIAASGVTIALAAMMDVNFAWLGLAAGLAALAVRTWA